MADTSEFGATAQPPAGPVTLAAYAAWKMLDMERLKSYGLVDGNHLGQPAVKIPYYSRDMHLLAMRSRIGWAGSERFRWRGGDKVHPYGLWKLPEAVEAGYVFLVEGESDCHSCWCRGVPAVGVPGASNFKDEWCSEFAGIGKVFLVREPDRGGDALLARVAKSPIRDSVYVVELGAYKDLSELSQADPEGFVEAIKGLMEAATPVLEILAGEARRANEVAKAECAELAACPDILERFARDAEQRGVVGEVQVLKLLYLAFTSRRLNTPVSVVVKGPSSGGKSFLVKSVAAYFPPGASYELTAMSERALAYDETDVAHRVMIVTEADGTAEGIGTQLMRCILSEGRLSYMTVEKTAAGLRPRRIEREGPTSLVTTTTAASLHPENETRMLSVTVADTQEQTKQIIRMRCSGRVDEPVGREWHALQEWLGAVDARVTIPFAPSLGELIPPTAVRLRRDISKVLTLIGTHALLHEATRLRDDEGSLVATLADYAAVRELVAQLVAEGVGATVAPEVRETVEAVTKIVEGKPGEGFATNDEISKALNLHKSSASHRARKATQAGYLVNAETGKGKPCRYNLGEPMPDNLDVLPTVERLRGCTEIEEVYDEDTGEVEFAVSSRGGGTGEDVATF